MERQQIYDEWFDLLQAVSKKIVCWMENFLVMEVVFLQ